VSIHHVDVDQIGTAAFDGGNVAAKSADRMDGAS
jgi:hypothetical protein